jgi:hypothetical protein
MMLYMTFGLAGFCFIPFLPLVVVRVCIYSTTTAIFDDVLELAGAESGVDGSEPFIIAPYALEARLVECQVSLADAEEPLCLVAQRDLPVVVVGSF